jgi:hypothetical protein
MCMRLYWFISSINKRDPQITVVGAQNYIGQNRKTIFLFVVMIIWYWLQFPDFFFVLYETDKCAVKRVLIRMVNINTVYKLHTLQYQITHKKSRKCYQNQMIMTMMKKKALPFQPKLFRVYRDVFRRDLLSV